MGFPSDDYAVVPKPVVLFFLFLAYIKYALWVVLRYVGLHSSEEPLIAPWEEHEFYFPDADADASPPTEPPAPPEPSSVKRQLMVVEFAGLRRRRLGCHADDEPTCVICLGQLEARHEVRELGNCGHGFHVECIDRWVDAGQVRCPLCRASLLPPAAATAVGKDGKWRRFLTASLGRR